jgi:hypothetical protein
MTLIRKFTAKGNVTEPFVQAGAGLIPKTASGGLAVLGEAATQFGKARGLLEAKSRRNMDTLATIKANGVYDLARLQVNVDNTKFDNKEDRIKNLNRIYDAADSQIAGLDISSDARDQLSAELAEKRRFQEGMVFLQGVKEEKEQVITGVTADYITALSNSESDDDIGVTESLIKMIQAYDDNGVPDVEMKEAIKKATADGEKLRLDRQIDAASKAAFDAWSLTVTPENPKGDTKVAFDSVAASNLPEGEKGRVETATKSRIANRQALTQQQLEAVQEEQLSEINKLTFIDKDYDAATAAVDRWKGSEKAKTSMHTTITARAKAAASGTSIKNDRVEENRLYELALGIWKGGSKRDFNDDLALNSGKLDDTAYQRVSSTAATTLKTSQAQDLSRANTEAARQIVDFQSEDAAKAFLSEAIRGLDPDPAKLFEQNFNKERAEQFRELSNFNAELRDWIEQNPDKTGKEFFVFSRGLENQYRLAKQTDTTVAEIKADKTSSELKEASRGATFRMIHPDGRVFDVPLDKVQKFTDNGFTGQ